MSVHYLYDVHASLLYNICMMCMPRYYLTFAAPASCRFAYDADCAQCTLAINKPGQLWSPRLPQHSSSNKSPPVAFIDDGGTQNSIQSCSATAAASALLPCNALCNHPLQFPMRSPSCDHLLQSPFCNHPLAITLCTFLCSHQIKPLSKSALPQTPPERSARSAAIAAASAPLPCTISSAASLASDTS